MRVAIFKYIGSGIGLALIAYMLTFALFGRHLSIAILLALVVGGAGTAKGFDRRQLR